MKVANMEQFVSRLRRELEVRCARNTNYSLRSFAKTLRVSHTNLSFILNGKREPSKKFVTTVGNRLGWSKAELRNILNQTGVTPISFQKISDEEYETISEWYYFAILSLTATREFQPQAEWIAKRLGIPKITAKLAFDKLVRLGYLGKADNKWKQLPPPLAFENTKKVNSATDLHRTLLAKATDALDYLPFESRDFSGVIFEMDTASLPYAAKRISQFRRELMNELSNMGSPQEVFSLNLQLFPLTKEEKSSSDELHYIQ